MSKKGDANSIFKLTFGIIAIIVIFFIVALVWPIGTNIFGQFIGTGQTLSTSLGESGVLTTNDSQELTNNLEHIDSGIQSSSWIPYTLFVGLIVVGGMFAYNAKTNPWLLPVWIGVIVFCTYLSISFNQSYELFITSALYANQDPFTDLLSRNIHLIVPMIGAILGILMFIIIQREPEYEVQQQ